MSEYSEFFLNSSSNTVQLETFELSHPNFSKVYYVVRNAVNGITAILETLVSVDFEYYPLRIESAGVKDDLDQSIKISFGDLGEVLPLELDLIENAEGFNVKPVLIYRTYRSDDLTAPLFGPIVLECVNFTFSKEGATFEAKAPSLNISKTGEVYNINRFPMLRGFL